MQRLGPLFCAFDVYKKFFDNSWSSNGPYGTTGWGDAKTVDGKCKASGCGEVQADRCGATGDDEKSGGHAVTCFGWGVYDDGSADGVKYWKCLNSWGSWGGEGRGEFWIKKGADVANFETYGCVGAELGDGVGDSL